MKTAKRTCLIFLLCLLIITGTLFPAGAKGKYDKALSGMTENINAVVLYDVSAKQTLYSKNANTKISVASTTKLLTSLVALRFVSPDREITVGNEIYMSKPNSSLSYIQPGHRLTLKQLIAALLLPSGNDAAYTIAVNVARIQSGNPNMEQNEAVKHFCTLMNAYALALGCKNTSFVNPEGWDDKNHYSTASDMCLIAREALTNVHIAEAVKINNRNFTFASGQWINWQNTNQLINPDSEYYCKYATGMKTGSTYSAGKCLVTSAEKNGRKLLLLVYGAKTDEERFGTSKKIIELILNAPVTGDVDFDAKITASDARTVLRASVSLEKITADLKKRGDIDKDKSLTATDARAILRLSVGLSPLSDTKAALVTDGNAN